MSKNLTVGLVSPYHFSSHGGVQEHTVALGEALKKLGVKVVYISPSPPSKSLPSPHVRIGAGVRVPTVNGSWAEIGMTKKSQEEIQAIINKHKIGILHFQELIGISPSWQTLEASNVINVATFHSGWDQNSGVELLRPLLKLLGRKIITPNIDMSIAVSKVAEKCNSNLLTNPHYIIPPAVNLERLKPRLEKPASIDKKKINILYIGRLDQRKGLQHLISALGGLEKKVLKKVVLQVIGAGPLLSQVEEEVLRLGLEKNVRFLGAFNVGKETYLQHSDIFVAPAKYGESFGIVLVEAMAAGLPIIAGNNEGYSETLAEYPCKECVLNPSDTRRFAEVLKRLVEDKELRKTLGAWGKKQAQKYAAEEIAKKHLAIYEELMEISKKPEMVIPKKKNDLAYYTFGSADKKLVVLHGHRSTALRLQAVLNYFGRSFRVLAPDFPGFGKSAVLTEEHTMDNLAKETARWIDQTMTTPYILVGFSMGGIVGVKMLKLLKNKPKVLVLFGTPWHYSHFKITGEQKRVVRILNHLSPSNGLVSGIFDKTLNSNRIMKLIYRRYFPELRPEQVEYEIKQWRSQSARVFLETQKDLLQTDLTMEPESDVQTIYLYSKHDNYIDMEKTMKAVRKTLPKTMFLELPLTEHVPKGEFTMGMIQRMEEVVAPVVKKINSQLSES